MEYHQNPEWNGRSGRLTTQRCPADFTIETFMMPCPTMERGPVVDGKFTQRFAVGGFTAGAHSGGDTAADKQRQGKE